MLRILCLSAILAGAPASAQTTLVHNVRGYALTDAGIQKFVALVVVDGKVEELIAAGTPLPTINRATSIDGKGGTLLPGLIDAHGHVLGLGQQRMQVELRGSESVQVALDRVKQFATRNSAGWLFGRGWNQVLWSDKQFPTAAQLDAIVATRPAVLSRVDGHAMWVNSAVLKLAGITRATIDPSGGQIVRDASGNPTGVLIDAAMRMVESRIPEPTDADIKHALQTALQELASLGLTGVHDAGVSLRTYRLYQLLGREDRLPIRVHAMLSHDKEASELIKAGPQPAQFGDRLQLRAVKAYVDGALGSRGAALLDDYGDQTGHRGLMRTTPNELRALAALAGKYGWQLNLHAIGDAGNRAALDAFDKGMTSEQRKALRPRVEHAQVISLTDIPRFAILNVIASIQPTHATSDMNMAEDRVGSERIKGAYAWRRLKNAGVSLAGGSDFPVELANPFHGLYAAITRQTRDGKPPGGWYAQEKLTREEALRLFTRDAAYAGHAESNVGSLQPGQWADFILLDRDYFTVPEDQVDDIAVLGTYVAGKAIARQ